MAYNFIYHIIIYNIILKPKLVLLLHKHAYICHDKVFEVISSIFVFVLEFLLLFS